jgi:hypothetical protein
LSTETLKATAAAEEAKKAAFESLSPEQQLKKKEAQAVRTNRQKERRADQTEGEKDDDNFKRRDAWAGRSKEKKEEANRKRRISQRAYRKRMKKAKVAETLKAREVAEALKALEGAKLDPFYVALKALPRFYCSRGDGGQ